METIAAVFIMPNYLRERELRTSKPAFELFEASSNRNYNENL
jgi:hypothetical protein